MLAREGGRGKEGRWERGRKENEREGVGKEGKRGRGRARKEEDSITYKKREKSVQCLVETKNTR